MRVYIITFILTSILALQAEGYDRRYVYMPYIEDENNKTVKKFLPYQHTLSSKIIYSIAILILIFVAGLRYHTGTDYWQYERNAAEYANDVWNSIITYNEPGIRILAKIGLLVNRSNPAPSMFFLASAITIGLFGITIFRYSDELFFPLAIFILLGCWTDSFNGVRQYLASAIFFCSISYMQSRRFLMYLLFVFLASLFHKSVLFLLPVYFLTNRKINWKNLLVIIISTSIILATYNTFAEYVASFMEVNSSGHYFTLNVNILRVLAGCSPGFLFWFICHDKEIDSEKTTYINLMMIHAAFWVISSQSAYLARVCIYTTPFITLGITRTSKLMKNMTGTVARLVIFVLYFAFWCFEINKSSNLRVFHWIWNARL